MGIDFLTILFMLFVPVLYVYLLLVRKGITIKAIRKRVTYIAPVAACLFFLLAFFIEDKNLMIRLILSGFILLSFLLDQHGFTEDALIINVFAQRGIPYTAIEKVVLLKSNGKIKMNYFVQERRGPMLTFKLSIEELLLFLEEHLNEEAKVEIMIEDE